MRPILRSVTRTGLLLGPVILLVGATGITAGAYPSLDDPVALGDCMARPGSVPESLAPHEIERLLDELYDLYAGMEGFVDVYFRPLGPVSFYPTFVDAVPPEAVGVATPVRVAFDVWPANPQPLGPGPMPSIDDVVCTGKVRPGMRFTNGCTASFIFRNGNTYYVGSAGHCFPNPGGCAWTLTLGRIGCVVFTTGHDSSAGDDFALIEVDAEFNDVVTGEMCNWAGPKTTFGGDSILLKGIVHTGHGSEVPTLVDVPPRPRIYEGLSWGSTSFQWFGGAIGGDSGSAIRLVENAAALGTVTHSLGVLVGTPTIGIGTRWDTGLELAGRSNYELVTVDYVHGL